MKVLAVRNVNDAYKHIIKDAISTANGVGWRRMSSRLGMDIMEYREPVATVYRNPRERVLFNRARDANPFFHLFESMWILAGRDDVEWISKFNTNIADFSEHGRYFHGAYGARLRVGVEQIATLIQHLTMYPESNRGVLSMWVPGKDLNADKKDIPCNTHIYFKARDGVLNMTVCCRSNDVIWGAYGANVVHFSILMEYIAANLDLGMGTYTQISDSFHIYRDNPAFMIHQKLNSVVDAGLYGRTIPAKDITPLVMEPADFDDELEKFMSDDWSMYSYHEPFFRDVIIPMRLAWEHYKADSRINALNQVAQIQSADWRYVAYQWIDRRIK